MELSSYSLGGVGGGGGRSKHGKHWPRGFVIYCSKDPGTSATAEVRVDEHGGSMLVEKEKVFSSVI